METTSGSIYVTKLSTSLMWSEFTPCFRNGNTKCFSVGVRCAALTQWSCFLSQVLSTQSWSHQLHMWSVHTTALVRDSTMEHGHHLGPIMINGSNTIGSITIVITTRPFSFLIGCFSALSPRPLIIRCVFCFHSFLFSLPADIFTEDSSHYYNFYFFRFF